jgi:hypothetical protein
MRHHPLRPSIDRRGGGEGAQLVGGRESLRGRHRWVGRRGRCRQEGGRAATAAFGTRGSSAVVTVTMAAPPPSQPGGSGPPWSYPAIQVGVGAVDYENVGAQRRRCCQTRCWSIASTPGLGLFIYANFERFVTWLKSRGVIGGAKTRFHSVVSNVIMLYVK